MIPCLDCGRLIDKAGAALTHGRRGRRKSRCPDCAAKMPYITNAETRRRAATVAEHRGRVGDWCPGWRRPPHPATDLTADHVVPVGAGGSEHGVLAVLCRPCNSSKHAGRR